MKNFNKAALGWTHKEFMPIFDEASSKLKDALEIKWDNASVGNATKDFRKLADLLDAVLLSSPATLLREIAHGCEFLQTQRDEGEDINNASVSNTMRDKVIQGLIQFPFLVEYLGTGRKDIPSLVSPLINEMRSLRSASPLSPSQLFSPDTFIDTDFIGEENFVSPEARKARVAEIHANLQSLLIQWIRKPQSKDPLQALSLACLNLSKISHNTSLKKLFWVGSVVFYATAQHEFVPSRECNVFLAKLESLAPWVAENELSSDQNQDAEKTLQQILYFITFEGIQNEGLESVVDMFGLEGLYYDQEDIDFAHAIMSGRGNTTLAVVAKEIKEDINKVRDDLDLFVRSPQNGAGFVDAALASLDKAQLTLQILSMKETSSLALAQKEHLVLLSPSLKKAPQTISSDVVRGVEEIASNLLLIEERLLQVSGDDKNSTSAFRSNVIDQMLINMAKSKRLITTFADSRQVDGLKNLPQLFKEVSSALLLINELTASASFNKLEALTEEIIAQPAMLSSQKDLENYAHILASLEYYIEAIRDEQPDPHRMLSDARQYLLSFGPHMDPEGSVSYNPSSPTPPPTVMKVEPKLVASPKKEQTIPAPATGLPAMSSVGVPLFQSEGKDEIDEDIREIFIEELADEIKGIQSLIDDEAFHTPQNLHNVRKSFHTIKGSGRMTHALALGDVAYAAEMVFNKILEGRRPYHDAIKEFAQKANTLFSQFHESATTGQPLVWKQDEFTSWAQRLVDGENISWSDHVATWETSSASFSNMATPQKTQKETFKEEEPSLLSSEPQIVSLEALEATDQATEIEKEPKALSLSTSSPDNHTDWLNLELEEEEAQKGQEGPLPSPALSDEVPFYDFEGSAPPQDKTEQEEPQEDLQFNLLEDESFVASDESIPDMSHEAMFDFGEPDQLQGAMIQDTIPQDISPQDTTQKPEKTFALDESFDLVSMDDDRPPVAHQLPQDEKEPEESVHQTEQVEPQKDNHPPAWDFGSLSLEPIGESSPSIEENTLEQGGQEILSLEDNKSSSSLELSLEEAPQDGPTIASEATLEEQRKQDHQEQKEDIPSLSSLEDLNAWNEEAGNKETNIFELDSAEIENQEVDSAERNDMSFEAFMLDLDEQFDKNQNIQDGLVESSSLPLVEPTQEPVPSVETTKQEAPTSFSQASSSQVMLELMPLPPTKSKEEDWKEFMSLLMDYNKSLVSWLDECQKLEPLSEGNQKILLNNLMGYQKREAFLITKALEKMRDVEASAIKKEIEKMLFADKKASASSQDNSSIPPQTPPVASPAPVPQVKAPSPSPVPQPLNTPQKPQPSTKAKAPSPKFRVIQPASPKTPWWKKIFKIK